MPPPAEGLTEFERHHALLRGYLQGTDPDGKTDARFALGMLRELYVQRPLDPRVTFSVDYGLADKLGNQLEALNADVALLRKSVDESQSRREALEAIDAIKINLEAAIKTCNELGLPW